MLSYLDRIDWGFIACRELVPGLQDMAQDVEVAHHELLKAAKIDDYALRVVPPG